jgi:hypothetical protein
MAASSWSVTVDSLWEAAQVIERLMAADRKAVMDAAQQ